MSDNLKTVAKKVLKWVLIIVITIIVLIAIGFFLRAYLIETGVLEKEE